MLVGLVKYRLRQEVAVSLDRKSTRLNSSHGYISYAVFCLKKKQEAKPAPMPSMPWCTTSRFAEARRVSARSLLCGTGTGRQRGRRSRARAVIFFKDTATTEIYTLSLHDALPIYDRPPRLHSFPTRRAGPPRIRTGIT